MDKEAIEALWEEILAIGVSPNAKQVVFFSRTKFDRAIATWLGRYGLEVKNVSSSLETQKNAIPTCVYGVENCGCGSNGIWKHPKI